MSLSDAQAAAMGSLNATQLDVAKAIAAGEDNETIVRTLNIKNGVLGLRGIVVDIITKLGATSGGDLNQNRAFVTAAYNAFVETKGASDQANGGARTGDGKASTQNRAPGGSMPPAAPTGPDTRPIKVRLEEYLHRHQLTLKQFALRCGVSIGPLYKIQKDQDVQRRSVIGKIEAVLADKAPASTGETKFDQTCEALIKMVMEAAVHAEQLDELLRLSFNRMRAKMEQSESELLVVRALRSCLEPLDPSGRVTALLELRDFFTKNANLSK